MITDNRISNIRKVTNVGVASYDGIFYFNGLADVTFVANGSISPNIAIGADFAVFTNSDVAFNVDSWENLRILPKRNVSIDHCVRVNTASEDCCLEGSNDLASDVE